MDVVHVYQRHHKRQRMCRKYRRNRRIEQQAAVAVDVLCPGARQRYDRAEAFEDGVQVERLAHHGDDEGMRVNERVAEGA